MITMLVLCLNMDVSLPFWPCFLFPLPAVFDFTAHEAGWLRSNNFKRLISGLFLGCGVGFLVHTVIKGSVWFGVLQVLWFVIIQLTVALTLHRLGQLERLIKRYEEAVRY